MSTRSERETCLTQSQEHINNPISNRSCCCYLGDLAEAGRVDGPVLGADRDGVPAFILRLTRSPSSSSTRVLLGQELLLHFSLLPVFLQFGLFVDLVDGLGALIASPRDPVILQRGGT